MADDVDVRPFSLSDYQTAMELWRSSSGIGLSSADDLTKIERYLLRNPGTSLVAESEDGIVAAVLAGHDGRRGFLYHLAVRADWRGRGLGTRLTNEACALLAERGIAKCHVLVYADNTAGHDFWESHGWRRREEIIVYSRDLL